MANESRKNKYAVITGASAGIGAELAREFASHGHDLVLVARSADKLTKLAKDLAGEHGVKIETVPLDLATPEAPESLHAEITRRGLSVDILVNNAGVLVSGPFAKGDLAAHRQLLQLNIGTLTALTHLFLPDMIRGGAGRILNVASTSAFQPVPTLSTYAASKSYVLSFSEALSIELRGSGVTVTALCPGFTETDMITRNDGGSMSLPGLRNMTAPEVARQGYMACMNGKPLYINGWGNRAVAEFVKHQPRWVQRLISGTLSKSGF